MFFVTESVLLRHVFFLLWFLLQALTHGVIPVLLTDSDILILSMHGPLVTLLFSLLGYNDVTL